MIKAFLPITEDELKQLNDSLTQKKYENYISQMIAHYQKNYKYDHGIEIFNTVTKLEVLRERALKIGQSTTAGLSALAEINFSPEVIAKNPEQRERNRRFLTEAATPTGLYAQSSALAEDLDEFSELVDEIKKGHHYCFQYNQQHVTGYRVMREYFTTQETLAEHLKARWVCEVPEKDNSEQRERS